MPGRSRLETQRIGPVQRRSRLETRRTWTVERRRRLLLRRCPAIVAPIVLIAVGLASASDGQAAPRLSLSLAADSDGATENSARVESDEYLFLIRVRSADGSSPEFGGGVESPELSLGSLSARGLERTLERPLSLGALSDERLRAGGYRVRRSGGYGDFPDAAVRIGPAAAFRRSTGRFASVGASVAGALPAGGTEPVVVRALAARSVPALPSERSDWITERPEPSGGPLWFFGVEAVGARGYAAVVLSAGRSVRSSVLATAVGDLRVGPVDLRAMLGGVYGEFTGADGIPAATRALGGLRVSLPRGRLVRPLARSELRLGTAAVMPRSVIPRSSDSRAGIELGPEWLFLHPVWRTRTDLSAERTKRVRHDASLGLRLAGDRSRVDIGARRAFDDREPGLLEAEIGARLALGVGARGRDASSRRTAADGSSETEIAVDASGALVRRDSRPDVTALVPEVGKEPELSGRLRLSISGERLEAGMRIDVADRGLPISRLSELVSSPLSWSAGTLFVRVESEFGAFRPAGREP